MAKGAKHTPGPWVTDAECGHESVLGPDGFMVADCAIFSMRKGAPTASRNRANARLIAAAPELLEALNWAMKQIGEPRLVRGQNDRHFNNWHAAKDAIAKAEGRSDAVRVEGVA